MRRWLARGLVLGGALLLAVVLAEGLVRMVAPQVTMFPRYANSAEYRIEMHPDVIIRHGQGGRWGFSYTTNELGRRGPSIPVSDPGGAPRVVVLGDSFTFGIGVGDGEVFTARAQEALGPRYAIVNGGMSGWGIDSQIKWFFQTGAQYGPEVVVLQFTANDPWDSSTGVTTVEGSDFSFHPLPYSKPLWQRLISSSGILQRSHLFSLVRGMASGGPGEGGGENSDEAVRRVQLRYIEFLDTFARQLQAQDIDFLLVSVTHAGADEYVYDLAGFPLIQADVARLEQEGLLGLVELPLGSMTGLPGSPEGHQWGPEHHRLVGVALADAILGGS